MPGVVDAFENANTVSKTRLTNILMELRKCVNHPYLFDGKNKSVLQMFLNTDFSTKAVYHTYI